MSELLNVTTKSSSDNIFKDFKKQACFKLMSQDQHLCSQKCGFYKLIN